MSLFEYHHLKNMLDVQKTLDEVNNYALIMLKYICEE